MGSFFVRRSDIFVFVVWEKIIIKKLAIVFFVHGHEELSYTIARPVRHDQRNLKLI